MSNHAVFQPGQVVFREGENSQEAYRIMQGRVEISILADGKPVILAQLGEGDIFGEMAMVDERPRSASAQALEVTECEVLTPENFNELVLSRPEVLIPYMASFFERLRTANDRLRLEMRLRAKAEQALASGMPGISAAGPVSRAIAPVAKAALPPPSLELSRVIVAPVAPPPGSTKALPPAPPPGGYQSVVLQALTEHAKARLPEPVITISKFPFRIGRKHEVQGKGATVFAANDIALADDKPYQISRNHCSIEREGDHFFVRDRGSTVGTVVNDKPIGLAEDTLTCDLHGGDNEILLGADDSPFKFKITLS